MHCREVQEPADLEALWAVRATLASVSSRHERKVVLRSLTDEDREVIAGWHYPDELATRLGFTATHRFTRASDGRAFVEYELDIVRETDS
jgi:hypothetical protein